jgi:hypothetical protein
VVVGQLDTSANSTTQKARAAGTDGQPARGRHAPRCVAADARSAGRGRGLAALPRPSQCRPAADKVKWLKIGTRRAARHRSPAHALWCWGQGRREAACGERLVRAARGVQRAQQGAARALSPRFSSRLQEGRSRANFLPKKNIHQYDPVTPSLWGVHLGWVQGGVGTRRREGGSGDRGN